MSKTDLQAIHRIGNPPSQKVGNVPMPAPRLLQRCAALRYLSRPVRLLGPLPRLPGVGSWLWGVAGRCSSLQHDR